MGFWRSVLAGILAVALSPATADEAAPPKEDLSNRFRVEGNRLIYDTEAKVGEKTYDIRTADVAALRQVLRDNDGIEVLELESTGGGHYPALELAEIVIDFGLDTHVPNICESSCVTVFLGGSNRTMARGARLGFHQLFWRAETIEKYYDDNKEWRDWKTPFDFAEWMYADTQTETYNRLTYMINRGVDPQFAVQSLRRPDENMWRPSRAILLAAKVLTE